METPKDEIENYEIIKETETVGEKRDRVEGFTVLDEGYRKVIITNDLRENQEPGGLVNVERIMYAIVKEKEEKLKIYTGGEKESAKNKENLNRPRNLEIAPARYDRDTGQLWLYNEEPKMHKQHLSEKINRKKDAVRENISGKLDRLREIRINLGMKKPAE
ncbi:MAG: hypothetical protein MUD10_04475 [Candidatus Pacebacteria bacterium]|jgi:hypothetical protein|nr:hypothetical protein [Candidatus Paceibacterota bacterium]